MKKLDVVNWANNANVAYRKKQTSKRENWAFVKFMIGALLVLLFVGFLEGTL